MNFWDGPDATQIGEGRLELRGDRVVALDELVHPVDLVVVGERDDVEPRGLAARRGVRIDGVVHLGVFVEVGVLALAVEDDVPGHEVEVVGEVLVPVFERGLELVPIDLEWLVLHAARNVTPSTRGNQAGYNPARRIPWSASTICTGKAVR